MNADQTHRHGDNNGCWICFDCGVDAEKCPNPPVSAAAPSGASDEQFDAWWKAANMHGGGIAWKHIARSAWRAALAHPSEAPTSQEISSLRWLLNITTEFEREGMKQAVKHAAKLLDDYCCANGVPNRQHLESLWSKLNDQRPLDDTRQQIVREFGGDPDKSEAQTQTKVEARAVLTDAQIEAAIEAWFTNDESSFQNRMRAAIEAAGGTGT
jgi:hypothetical protein